MLKNLPKPISFEQGQRAKFGSLMAYAGIFCGLVALALVIYFAIAAVKMPAFTLTILWFLAGALFGYLVLQSVVMIAMAVGGPVGRFKVSATKEGASLEASDDEYEPRRKRDPCEAPDDDHDR